MATKYVEAPQVAEIAQELIKKYHPHLLECDIAYFFFCKVDKDGAYLPEDKWGDKLGYVRLYPQELRTMQNVTDFGMGILANYWDQATDKQREALVDHELCHCQYDVMEEDPKPKLRKHEFEGFLDEIERHGAWDNTLKAVAGQLQMQLEEVA